MLDLHAGIWTQVSQMRKRLKEMDATKVDPRELSSTIEALDKLEQRLEKQNEKKKQRQLEKETKEKQLAETTKVSEETKPTEVKVEATPGDTLTPNDICTQCESAPVIPGRGMCK